MSKKTVQENGENEIVRRQDVIRSLDPLKKINTDSLEESSKGRAPYNYIEKNSLLLSFLMIYYMVIYSLLSPPRFPEGDVSIMRILMNVFSFSWSRVLVDRVWIWTTIIFILSFSFCCRLSFNSIVRYYRDRRDNKKYPLFIMLGSISLAANIFFILFNVWILYLLVAGFKSMF